MDADLAKQIFLSARDKHDRAGRWCMLALTLGVLFHALVFTRYVTAQARRRESESAVAVLTARRDRLDALRIDLSEFSEGVDEQVRGAIDAELRLMRGDFIALDLMIKQIRNPPAADAGAPIRPPGEFPPVEGMTTQMPPTAMNLPAMAQGPPPGMPGATPNAPAMMGNLDGVMPNPTFSLPDDARKEIARVSMGRLGDVVRPLAEELIIDRRFRELNENWRRDVAPVLRGKAEDLRARLTLAASDDPAAAEPLNELSKRLSASLALIADPTFKPPEQRDWWRTVEGKMGAMYSLGERLGDDYRQRLGSQTGLEELGKVAGAALAKQAEAAAKLEAELKQIKEQFARQTSSLATLGKPFEFLAADLDFVVGRWPMLLGLLLAGAAVFKGLADRELAAAATVAGANGSQSVAARWMAVVAGGSPLVRGVGRALVGCVWIGLAAWQLLRWPTSEGTGDVVRFAMLGAAIYVGAEAWRVVSMRRAMEPMSA